MRSWLLTPVLLSFLLSCQHDDCKKVNKPEFVGKQVVKVLSTLNEANNTDFENCFVSVDEVISLTPEEEHRKEELEEKRNADLTQKFEALQEFGKMEKIDWYDLQMLDFHYELDEVKKNDKLIVIVEGVTTFQSKNRSFQIKSSSVKIEKQYYLGELRQIKSL